MKGPSQQITFRLASEYSDELEERAKLAGISTGKYARQVLISTLTSNPEEETRNRVAEMQDELQKLREELWASVTALLAFGGKTDAKKAQDWVRKNLMK